LEQAGLNYLQRGPGIAVVADGGVVMVGGVAYLRQGVWEAWAMTSELVWPYRFSFHKAALEFLREQLNRPEVAKIVAAVHRDNGKARRWIKALGFREEGRELKYGGLVFVRYGREKRAAGRESPHGGRAPRLRGLPAPAHPGRLR